jgi:ATP-dependent helicase/nuclease subunit B
MSVRLIAGRAGTGKTHYCLTQICRALALGAADPGAPGRLILLVPEQAALQMERGILGMLQQEHGQVSPDRATPVLGRCEVLGFRRLAHRILNETPGSSPVVLSSNGRQMALRHLLNRHRRELREFHRVAERTGFIRMVAQSVSSLLQECTAPDQVANVAVEAESRNDPSARRLHDLALIYRAYLEYLGDERVDPEGVLDLARARLQRSQWLRDAQIWVDGFAGLTQQQERMIVELAARSSQLEIALLLDPRGGGVARADIDPDELSLFARTEQTWSRLSRELRESGIAVDPPLLLDKPPMRFSRAPMISRIERDLFHVPQRSEKGPWPEPVPCGHLRLVIAPERRAEVAAVVREILDLVQRPTDPMRYRDIAVIVRDLSPYHDLLSAQLRAHDIPFFIDRRRPIHHHPLVTLLRSSLAMHTRGAFGPCVISMLKTALLPLDEDAVDRLENYMLAYGLVSVESWAQPWVYAVQPRRDGKEPSPSDIKALEELNALRDRVMSLLGDWLPAPASPAHPHASTWLTRLYGLLERCAVPIRLAEWHGRALSRGELDTAAEHQQIWSDVCGLFDELHEALGGESMTARQFMECLEAGLAEFTLGLVPATLDQVLVSSIERSRHPPIKAAFVLGVTDQDFPARIDDDELLGDAEKLALASAKIDMGRLRADRILDERMLAYVACTRPSEILWVSYPRTDQSGKAMLPSPYWMALRSAVPEISVDEIESEGPETISTGSELAGALAQHLREQLEGPAGLVPGVWSSLYDWARAEPRTRSMLSRAFASLAPPKSPTLSKQSCDALWRAPFLTSVTALEDYAACPFRHYARRALRLEPRRVHELSAIDLGTLYHGVLQQFVNEMIESQKTLQDFSDEAIAERVAHYCETVLPTLVEAKGLEEPARRLTLWRGRRELNRAVRAQKMTIADSPLTPGHTELSFGRQADDLLPALQLTLPDGKTVLLRGQIDRVDLVPAEKGTLAVVYDYKRSAFQRRLHLQEAYHGLALQLLAYLLVLRESGKGISGMELLPGGAFYLPLLGPPKKVKHPREAESEEFNAYADYRPRGVIDFDHVEQLEPGLKEGRGQIFSVSINKDGSAGNVNRTDVVYQGGMNRLLDHVMAKMIELSKHWLAGEIPVMPFQLGQKTACTYCELGSVCRMEYASRSPRNLVILKRTEVMEALSKKSGPQESQE